MNGPDSISDPVARKISYIGSYPSARSSALTQLASTRLGSAHDWWCGRWVPTCQLTGRWHGMPTVHADVIIMSCWHHPYPGRSRGSGQLVFGSSQPIRAKKTHGARGQPPYRQVRPYLTSDFDVVFTSMIVSSSSTQWYCQNTILTTFIFGKKSNTTLNHMLWYQLLGILTGDVLIVAHWRLSTLRHNI